MAEHNLKKKKTMVKFINIQNRTGFTRNALALTHTAEDPRLVTLLVTRKQLALSRLSHSQMGHTVRVQASGDSDLLPTS